MVYLVVLLWVDFNGGAAVNGFPYLLHIFVAKRYAAIGPVKKTTDWRGPAPVVGLTVNHNVATGVDTEFSGGATVFGIWVGNMDRFIEGTVCVFIIEHIGPFGCFFIALLLFVTDGLCSKGDIEFGKYLAFSHKKEDALTFIDRHDIGFIYGVSWRSAYE